MESKLKKVRNEILKKYDVSTQNRVFLHKSRELLDIDNINDIQLNSYKDFLQEDVLPEERKSIGLQFLFNSIFPFESTDKKIRVEFKHYSIDEKKYTREEAIALDQSYTIPIRATIELILEERGEIKEQEIYICDMPYMTDTGTFIINGAERVVVSQIHRSPGVIFGYSSRANMFHSRLIPNRGPWLEFEIVKEVMYVRIDRKARLSITSLLKALGIIDTREAMIQTFFETENVKITNNKEKMNELLVDRYLAKDIVEKIQTEGEIEKEEVVFFAGERLYSDNIDRLIELSLKKVELITSESAEHNEVLLNTLEKDMSGSDKEEDSEKKSNIFESSRKEACILPYVLIRGTEPSPSVDVVKEVEAVFFDEHYYSLGSVGRYKINKKFSYDVEGRSYRF